MKKLNTFFKALGLGLISFGFGGYLYADPINEFGNTYELVLIYSSDCPHCQRFVPIFADVAKHYNIKYDAFTMNGGTLPPVATHTYPANQQIMNNFYQGMQQGVVPAVFIINVNTMDELPISIGEEPEAQFIADVNRVAAVLFTEESAGTTGANNYSGVTSSVPSNGAYTQGVLSRSYPISTYQDDDEDEEQGNQSTANTDSAAPVDEDSGITDSIEATSLAAGDD